MDEARVFPVRVNGAATTVFLSADELVEAAEQGRLMIAPEDAEDPTQETGCEQDAGRPAKPARTRHKSLFDALEEISRAVPEEIWATLPDDLSANHDHYIYGTPKR